MGVGGYVPKKFWTAVDYIPCMFGEQQSVAADPSGSTEDECTFIDPQTGLEFNICAE